MCFFSLSSTFQLSFSPLVLAFSSFTFMESLQNTFLSLVLPISLQRTPFLNIFLFSLDCFWHLTLSISSKHAGDTSTQPPALSQAPFQQRME